MGDIQLIWEFLLEQMGSIWALYTGSFVLASVIALFIFRKVINFFKLIF